MAHTLGLVLLAAFYAGAVLYTYDLLLAGPAWVRVLLAQVMALASLALTSEPRDPVILYRSVPAAMGALLLVALLQLLEVKRDAAMTQVMRRR